MAVDRGPVETRAIAGANSAIAHDCDPVARCEDHGLAHWRRPAHGPPHDADAAGLRNRALSAAERADVVLGHQQPTATSTAIVAGQALCVNALCVNVAGDAEVAVDVCRPRAKQVINSENRCDT